jgi:hypothetical protein
MKLLQKFTFHKINNGSQRKALVANLLNHILVLLFLSPKYHYILKFKHLKETQPKNQKFDTFK